VLGRWTRRGPGGTTQAQVYYDRVERHVPNQFGERRNTVDLDVQHALAPRGRHSLVVGSGYRASADDTDSTPVLFFDPKQRTTHLFNLYAQDEIELGRELFGTVGTKVEWNTYSHWEVQPTARLRWTRRNNTLWGAVSRAVRMPTRFDTDIRVRALQPFVVITGNPDFRSESLVAYEGGFRSQPARRVSYEASVYHNQYDDLRSQNRVPGAPITLGNDVAGHINGLELAGTWEPSNSARVHGSYTWLHRSIAAEPGSTDITGGEGNDATHLATLQVFADLRPDLRLNLIGRYVGALPRPHLSAYGEADVTLQWDLRPRIELALVGQNLLHDRHPEFWSGQPNLERYERSVFVTLTYRYRGR
jgi:iron complex outermembrane recepter protein